MSEESARLNAIPGGHSLPRSGLDVLLASAEVRERLRDKRVGLLAHAASVTGRFVHAIDALLAAGVPLVRLFGPEHGLRGELQMMEAVEDALDVNSGLPVVSLYGHDELSLSPRPESLEGLDVMLIDVQDIGARYYTYAATGWLLARACARRGIEVFVLDRPNPIGRAIEGPDLESGFASFVGLLRVPTRHGLTVGELLTLAAHQEDPELAHLLTVVRFEGFRADRYLDECSPHWVLPSPNMPSIKTATVYPGLCLLEATNISEGRGTTLPFEVFGAPWLNARALREELERRELPGVAWREVAYLPTFDKYQGTRCAGLQIHVTDRERFLPVLTGATIISAVMKGHRAEFDWRPGAYEFVLDRPAIDLLAGSDRLRRLLLEDAPQEELVAWARPPAELADACAAAHLYAQSGS